LLCPLGEGKSRKKNSKLASQRFVFPIEQNLTFLFWSRHVGAREGKKDVFLLVCLDFIFSPSGVA
jgi:hypothetical protein